MKLKVVESKMSSSFLVVQDCYGEERTALNGVKYSYEPLPLCRVPDGYGRTREEARVLAERIARLLEADLNGQGIKVTTDTLLPHEESVPF